MFTQKRFGMIKDLPNNSDVMRKLENQDSPHYPLSVSKCGSLPLWDKLHPVLRESMYNRRLTNKTPESGVPFVTQVLGFAFAFVAIGRHRGTVQSPPGKYFDNEKVVMHCNTNLAVKNMSEYRIKGISIY